MKKNEWGDGEIEFIDNKNLDCHNCIYKTSMTGICAQYMECKPLKVIQGKKCDKKTTGQG